MKRFARALVSCMLLVLLAQAVAAQNVPLRPGEQAGQQTAFQVQELGRSVQFNFAWTGPTGSPHSLNFSLPRADLERGEREFAPFDNTAANTFAFERVKKTAAAYRAQGLDVQVKKTFSGYRMESNLPPDADPDAIMRTLEQAQTQGIEDYIQAAFYTRMQGNNIMPDHKRIARRYAPALAPLTQAVAAQTPALGVRERAEWVAHFLQTIPYDTLLDRFTSNGAGFQTPYGLFRRNRGDCDTKSVALLAILRGLYPTLPLTMVYVPEHAFVGVGIPQGPNDFALNLGGRTFVLIDPTGPRQLRVGEVEEKALGALMSGRFSYQEVPF